MKILVAIKRVIDYSVKVHVKSDESNVDLSNTKMAINPFCEIAVEEAVRMKESGIATEIVAVSIGPQKAQEQLRTALATGADRGVLVQTDAELDALSTAKILASVVTSEAPDLVLLGKQAIDSDNNQTGQMLAALMDCPQGTFASQVTFEEDNIKLTREIDGGLQTLELQLPAVITTDLRLNEPRYLKLPDIMKAKRKKLDTFTPDDLGIKISSNLKLLKIEAPQERSEGIRVASVAELIDKLKNEAQVL